MARKSKNTNLLIATAFVMGVVLGAVLLGDYVGFSGLVREVSNTPPSPTLVETVTIEDTKSLRCSPDSQINLSREYKNSEYRFSVFYPDNWFPSGDNYSNYFGLINYNPSSALPSREQRASIQIELVHIDESQVNQQLDKIGNSLRDFPGYMKKYLTIQDRQAVYVSYNQQVSQSGAPSDVEVKEIEGFVTKTYLSIADGSKIINIQAISWGDSSSEVLCEIYSILTSIEFE